MDNEEDDTNFNVFKHKYDTMWRGVYGTISLNAFSTFKNKNIVKHVLYRVVSTEEEPEPRFVAVGRIIGETNSFNRQHRF